MTAEIIPFRCRFVGCAKPAAYQGQARCDEHRLRWLPGAPVEQAPMSPWVRNAQAGRLPSRITGGSAA